MGDLTPYADLASHHMCKSLYSGTYEKSCIEQEYYTSSHLDTVAATSAEDLVVHELGAGLCRILQVHDTCMHSCLCSTASNHLTSCCQKDIKSLSFEADMQKCTSNSPVIPSSGWLQSHHLAIDGVEESINIVDVKNLSQTGILSSSNSVAIPVKLISCLKGARALHGKSPNTSFRVKWAPEVYDPPVTSASRTVKSHNQRSKAKRKECHKHKSDKGKSARRISSELKHANRRSKYNAIDPRIIRLRSLNDKSVPLNFRPQNINGLDFTATGQDSKCGNSFYMEFLASMHTPVAEAS
ncbi:uncharacterized protein LOC120269062 [Dioscorea cayenensis subsp. rotundata]|uniref:Uncharacterized protein LOC120269062 n=1 Tax=Dioscorea cayennensis subsp. rotundata TaxID=55577 RepID=A0AB40BZ76_DIOCR|nr:uncharacterized protein LOC120269062 [Dioscorea cayenensis subsp. rotundata]